LGNRGIGLTRKDENLRHRLLLCSAPTTQPLDGRSSPSIRSAFGVGEEVFVRGKEASFPFHPASRPLRRHRRHRRSLGRR
jgi:hypothetical protein